MIPRALLVLPMILAAFGSADAAPPAPLTFSVTMTGTHDIDWVYHLKTNTGVDGFVSDLAEEGSDFVDYRTSKAVTMVFKSKGKGTLVGTVPGKGIAKFPKLRVTVTNGNVPAYSCIGKCPPPPDLAPLSSGCGSKKDTANVKLSYSNGTFVIEPLRMSELSSIPGGSAVPTGIDLKKYVLPIGVLMPQGCGPIFPPNNPAQDLIDYRYPFLLETTADIFPGKSAVEIDKKLKKIKKGKTLVVKFSGSLSPAKTLLFDGTGYTYQGELGVFWTIRLKRIS